MKLLKVIIILTSLLCYATMAKAQNLKETKGSLSKMPPPIWLDEAEISVPMFLWRTTQYLRFRLSKQEKQQHQSAVFFMLDNVKNGQIVSWYSDKRLANGKVRVIHTYPISGGYCRTYQTYIKLKSKSRHMTNNACKYIGSPSWSFYK